MSGKKAKLLRKHIMHGQPEMTLNLIAGAVWSGKIPLPTAKQILRAVRLEAAEAAKGQKP